MAAALIREAGYCLIGYSVLGDAGATYSAMQVKAALLHAAPGAIIICHINHPESGTAQGIMEAIPLLRERGFSFVQLSEHLPEQLTPAPVIDQPVGSEPRSTTE